MSEASPIQITAQCDQQGRLLRADEPLAGLQLRCGGSLPGEIAVPELRQLVAKAREFGMKLARPIVAQDGQDWVRAWIEVAPDAQGSQIVLRHWQASPIVPENELAASQRRADIDRALAELVARLDARQRVLAVEAEAADLQELARAMRASPGQAWTDFVAIEGQHHQPLHWRLLDGARLRVAGSARLWRASLIAHQNFGQTGRDALSGFDLLLTSPEPLVAPLPPANVATTGRSSLIGRELAPVLRQPLAAIIANAQTIHSRRAGPVAQEYADYAGDIAAAGQHLLGLIDDLADIEAIETRGFVTAADPIDLADVARKAAGILGGRAREKSISLHVPAPDASLPAVAEFRRALQVLLNLIGNAIRYSPDNSSVFIKLERVGNRARIAVADQGPGLSAQDALRVFDKFERLGRSGDGGTGLGLYISRKLARAMGGDLTVESEEGAGARFVLDLPLNA